MATSWSSTMNIYAFHLIKVGSNRFERLTAQKSERNAWNNFQTEFFTAQDEVFGVTEKVN